MPIISESSPGRRIAFRFGTFASVIIMAIVFAIVRGTTQTQFASAQAESANCNIKGELAFQAAECAANNALWHYKHNNAWRAEPSGNPSWPLLTGSIVEDLSLFTYTVTCRTAGNGVTIRSSATDGKTSSVVSMNCAPIPQIYGLWIGGSLSSHMQFSVTGDIASAGDVATDGDFKVSGNLTTGGAFGRGTVSGNLIQHAASPMGPNIIGIYNNLLPGAESIAPGNLSTLDFTKNPIIAVAGDLTLNETINVIGSGTLLVSGKVVLDGTLGTAVKFANINVVCLGDFNGAGGFFINGCIYVNGDFTENQFSILGGVFACGGNAKFNGDYTFVQRPSPVFDSRSSKSILVSSFSYDN